jgi:hypothetical protein
LVSVFLTGYQEAHADTEANEFPYGITRGDGYTVIVGDEDAIRQHEADVVESKLNDDDPTDDASYRMIRDLGGLTEYHKFLDRTDPDEISALKAAYGVETVDLHAEENSRQTRDSSPEEIGALFRERCPKVYAPDVRGKEYEYHGNTFKIDSLGRPAMASTLIAMRPYPGSKLPDGCAKTIRDMGQVGDQAGHLIPKPKGGPGIRANLVPQNGNLNGGEWRDKFEGSMFKCSNDTRVFGGYYKVYLYLGQQPSP